jgi:tryptophan-rich sensory protein
MCEEQGGPRVTYVDEAPDEHRYGALKYFIVLTLAVGALAAVATEPEIAGWYGALNKPSFNPPNWLFAPVWTALYVIMAVAAWRVWRVVGLKSVPLVLFFVQLALNFAWSFLFFRFYLIGVALADIGLLLILIVATAIAFWQRDRLAGLLFLPYIAWVVFASALNLAIWQLN